jgi:hypothetical protein
MSWLRSGECPPERCQGHCCNHMGFWVEDKPSIYWAQIRGAQVSVFGDRALIALPQRCQYLRDDNLCALHTDMNPSPDLPTRPDNCGTWPEDPSQTLLDPNCGFTFEWVEDPVEAKG